MASIVKHYCDRCNSEIAETPEAESFEDVQGIAVTMTWCVRGFCTANHTLGYFGERAKEYLLCRQCFKEIKDISKIHLNFQLP